MSRVLAIRPRALGDVVLTTPALRALARAPGVELDVATETAYAPLLEGLPGVSRVWRMGRGAGDTLRLIRSVRARRYDRVVDFFGNPRTALVTRASGAPLRAGYDLRGRARAYTLRAARSVPPTRGEREYAAAVHVRLAVAAGGVDDGLETRVAVPESARAQAPGLLAAAGVTEPRRAIGLVAAGTWPTKTWPLASAARLAQGLIAAGWDVLALTGPAEQRALDALMSLVPGLRALPPCDVAGLAAVIERLGAVVGTDSGPRHLAVALGVPSYAWFGPTHPDTWSPPSGPHGYWRTDLPCRACDRTACPHWSCMPALDPRDALAGVLEHLEHHARNPADLRPAAGA